MKNIYMSNLSVYLSVFEIRKMEKSTNIDKGEDLTIECPVEGDPYPIIQWKKGILTETLELLSHPLSPYYSSMPFNTK